MTVEGAVSASSSSGGRRGNREWPRKTWEPSWRSLSGAFSSVHAAQVLTPPQYTKHGLMEEKACSTNAPEVDVGRSGIQSHP